ncbi:hypothetical protein V5P93_003578 [Actinokineospora auranticolor]|uniref:hypothetical protein n=1 Tax=Actinokineospora auranticolor TaxID=155976 RepID=UPI0011B0AAD6|nr:hypothetical protein [Actinokineospora auranticolor]
MIVVVSAAEGGAVEPAPAVLLVGAGVPLGVDGVSCGVVVVCCVVVRGGGVVRFGWVVVVVVVVVVVRVVGVCPGGLDVAAVDDVVFPRPGAGPGVVVSAAFAVVVTANSSAATKGAHAAATDRGCRPVIFHPLASVIGVRSSHRELLRTTLLRGVLARQCRPSRGWTALRP